jgi:hypothetical protein
VVCAPLVPDALPLLRPERVGQAFGHGITLITLNPLGKVGWRDRFSQDENGWPSSSDVRRAAYEDNWRCYAWLHGYRLVIERDDQLARWRFPAPTAANETASADSLQRPAPYSPFWVKVELLERELPRAQWVVYLDSDALFLSLPERIERVLGRVARANTDLVVAANKAGEDAATTLAHTLCACVFAVRSSPGGWWFVRRWFALREHDNLWGDQGAFHHAVLEMHLRHDAARRAGAHAPPWHSPSYDGIVSPCLHAHWSQCDAALDIGCISRTMRALDARPRADELTAWPVAWSTELVTNLGINLASGSWERRKAQVAKHVTRGGQERPVLVAHSKTGLKYPLLSIYHASKLERLARLCPAQLALLNASSFVRAALLGTADGRAPSEWRLWRALGGRFSAPLSFLRDL